MAAGRTVELSRGEHLIRRGERGGDMYLVEEGTLEVVDTRSSPEVVITLMGPGALVGEMAFLDEAPRAADVRAASDARCLVWERDLLLRALQGDAAFSKAFYEALAVDLVARLRAFGSTAVVGAIGKREEADSSTAMLLGRKAQRLSVAARDGFLEADARFRRDVGDAEAVVAVQETFRGLVDGVASLLGGRGGPELASKAGEQLHRELHPYLIRARTGQLATEPPEGHAGGTRVMAHLLRGRPAGDGAFGQALDAAVLELPTADAFRRRSKLAARSLLAALPEGAARVTVVPAAAGGVLPRVYASLGEHGCQITAVDGSTESLRRLEDILPPLPQHSALRLLHEDLAMLVSGRSSLKPPPQDFVVVDGLAEYLPDRMVAALARWCRDILVPGGELILTGIGEAPDAAIFDHLLQWPLVRRDGAALRALVEAAGLRGGVVSGARPEDGAAVVVRGRRA